MDENFRKNGQDGAFLAVSEEASTYHNRTDTLEDTLGKGSVEGMEGVLNSRINEVIGHQSAQKLQMSDKKQSKVSLRKRIIRRIVNNGGTSPIVGLAYLERSVSPSGMMKQNNFTNRDKKQQQQAPNNQLPLDYSLPGDSGITAGGVHNEKL